jgi:4-amino-4-deoxy-L-arabinose transferase-like glycosyltransferase
MGEAVGWSREIALGTSKHPPLSAWVVGAWFSVFPLQDWAYYLLSMILIAGSLWVIWKISANYLSGEKLAVAFVLLTFVPFFNFHALKFNVNLLTTLTSALVTWAFIRAYETRNPAWSIVCGLLAALAMLAKYWSVFLLIGFALIAISDERRALFWRSSAPWLIMLAGAVGLAPHVWWLLANDFPTFSYALAAHPSDALGAVWQSIYFLIVMFCYLVAPILIVATLPGLTTRSLRDVLLPADRDRRFVLKAFVLPILSALLFCIVEGFHAVSLWSCSLMTLVPVVLLSSDYVQVPRRRAVAIVAAAIVVPVAAIIGSPAVALVKHFTGPDNNSAHYSLLARAIEEQWHKDAGDARLRLVGGDMAIANGVIFYAKDRPSTYDGFAPSDTPWVDARRLARQGIALVCPTDDNLCLSVIRSQSGDGGPSRETMVSLSRPYWGWPGKTSQYLIRIVLPQ